jgi:hypothetical protein
MKIFPYFSILLILLTLLSCNKKNQDYLFGEWDLLTKPNPDLDYKWHFTEDKVYILATDANENESSIGELDTCSYGSYILKNGIITIALPERPCRGSVFNGDWDIQVLNENVMALRRETRNGPNWYEFKKEIATTENED